MSPHVSLGQFQSTLAMARSVAEPVPLRELTARHLAGRSTAGLFSLTFDDAYHSLTTHGVRDLLSDVPATIFVVTGASATGATFWWDRLEALHDAVSAETWSEFERAMGVPDWYRTPASTPFGPLRPLRQWVLHRFKGRWPREAERALAELESAAHGTTPQRAMTFEEIDALTRHGLIDVGVHTVSHPVLPLLADAEARDEIGGSFATLRDRWPRVVPWLAVPFGLYDDRTERVTREAGLSGILTLQPFPLSAAGEPHGLARTNVSEGAKAWKLGLRLSGLITVLSRLRGRSLRYPPLPGPD